MSELHVMHLNVNSLRLKCTLVDQYLGETKPDIVCFNETKLNGRDAPRLTGYQLICSRDRQVDRVEGGGAAIYARRGILCSDISPDIDDVVAIEIRAGNQVYAVVSYYCPPTHAALNVPMLDGFANRYDRLIVAGDLNAKHQYFGSSKTEHRGEILFDLVERHDMYVANNTAEPTRHCVVSGQLDLLDVFLVSKALVGKVEQCYVGDLACSDHFPVHLSLRLGGNINSAPTKKVRILAKCDWDKFSEELLSTAPRITDSSFSDEAGIDATCEQLEGAMTHALDVACPYQTVKDYAFRVSAETLKLIREKRKIRRKLQRDPSYRTMYNNITRQVNQAVKLERQAAWERATESLNQGQGHQFWRKFKSLTGGARPRPRVRLQTATGQVTDEEANISEIFATSLASIHKTHEGPEFCANTRYAAEQHVESHSQSFTPLFPAQTEPLDDSPLVDEIDLGELQGALRKCRNRSAPGPDGISYTVLKKVPEEILLQLALLFSRCLAHGYFPKRWKEAHGVMLAKPGKDTKQPCNYRPISLLSTMGKLFERIVARRLSEHFRIEGFINDWQCAYQSGKEAADITYRLGEEVRLAKAKGWVTTVVSLDVEKAFDSVWHDGLRYKLRNLGLPVKLNRLLSSFLSDRTVRVRVGSTLSRPVRLEAGTPQGSVLSPLLYLVYVNDIPIQPTGNCHAGQFADDMNVWTSCKKYRVANVRLQRALTEIERWCSKWRIKINVAKTQLLPFTNRRNVGFTQNLNLTLFGQKLVCSPNNEAKILGITYDWGLSLVKHCERKAATASKKTNLLRALRGRTWGANRRTMLKLYKQYIRPVLEYGCVITANGSKSAIASMELVERRALRIATGLPLRTCSKELYRVTGLTPLAERLTRLQRETVKRLENGASMRQLADFRTMVGK